MCQSYSCEWMTPNAMVCLTAAGSGLLGRYKKQHAARRRAGSASLGLVHIHDREVYEKESAPFHEHPPTSPGPLSLSGDGLFGLQPINWRDTEICLSFTLRWGCQESRMRKLLCKQQPRLQSQLRNSITYISYNCER